MAIRSKFLLSSISIAIGAALATTGCQSLEGLWGGDEKTTVSQAPATSAPAQPTKPSKPQKTQQPQRGSSGYEMAPDLSNAEMLISPGSPHNNSNLGGLISDANTGSGADGMLTMQNNPQQVSSNVALSGNLEQAPTGNNTQLGAADPYLSVNESAVSGGIATGGLVFDANAMQQQQRIDNAAPPPRTTVSELAGYEEQQNGACSVTLHTEASGVARTLIKELAGRLRSESGSIYVAPTIVDREYEDCVGDLSIALQDGLLSANQFNIVPATTNLNNIISQNIGSSTILPSLIHQCRASDIPYLVVSQIRKTGDKAALTLRIIRTNDGITLSQTFRRLSQ